jgi:hypothetical protein
VASLQLKAVSGSLFGRHLASKLSPAAAAAAAAAPAAAAAAAPAAGSTGILACLSGSTLRILLEFLLPKDGSLVAFGQYALQVGSMLCRTNLFAVLCLYCDYATSAEQQALPQNGVLGLLWQAAQEVHCTVLTVPWCEPPSAALPLQRIRLLSPSLNTSFSSLSVSFSAAVPCSTALLCLVCLPLWR